MNIRKERTAIEKTEWMRNLLAFSLVGAFIWCIVALLFKEVPEGNSDIITYMIGQLSGMALTALGFYFVNKVGQDALDNKRAENTGKLADAVTTAVQASTPTTPLDVKEAAEQVAAAADDKKDEIVGKAT